jgi:hypothetical protein
LAQYITAISVALAALSFVVGVSAWKREFVGKRRIELAESVLSLFYEAEDAIRQIRSPSAGLDEGKTRQRGQNESEEVSDLLDQAYVAFERYQKREQLFAQLRATRYRFMAAFGADASKPYDELDAAVREILVAARMLGTHYWQRQGRVAMSENEFKRHLVEMQRYEAVFWSVGDDQMAERVHTAVGEVEAITSRTVTPRRRHRYDPRRWFAGGGS